MRGGGYPAQHPFGSRIQPTHHLHHLHAGERLSGVAGNTSNSLHSLDYHGRERSSFEQIHPVKQNPGLVRAHQLSDVPVALAVDQHEADSQPGGAETALLRRGIRCMHHPGMADDKTHRESVEVRRTWQSQDDRSVLGDDGFGRDWVCHLCKEGIT